MNPTTTKRFGFYLTILAFACAAAWLLSGCAGDAPEPKAPPDNTVIQPIECAVLTAATVYDQPNSGATPLGTLPVGDIVIILEVITDDPTILIYNTDGWVRIQHYLMEGYAINPCR